MNETLETFVPLQLARRQGRLVDTEQPGFDPVLLESIGRAFHWQQLLDSGVVKSSADIARREKLNPSSVTRILHLALLSPEIIKELLAGRQPRTLTLEWLKRHRLPNDWRAQKELIQQPFD